MMTSKDDGAKSSASEEEIVAMSEQIRRALECPICLNLMSAISCHCPNGHAVCQTCTKTLFAANVTPPCPMCRTPMNQSAGMSAMAVMLAEATLLTKVACSNRHHGCRELVAVRDVEEHESGCRFVPDVRCRVSACRWIGLYEQLYRHVCTVHPDVAKRTLTNRLRVADAEGITSDRPQTYLVRSSAGLMWVLLSRSSRSRVRVGLSLVKDSRVGVDCPADSGPSPGLLYRITWLDNCHRTRTTEVHWTDTLDAGDPETVSSAYTVFRSMTGRMEICWFLNSRDDYHL